MNVDAEHATDVRRPRALRSRLRPCRCEPRWSARLNVKLSALRRDENPPLRGRRASRSPGRPRDSSTPAHAAETRAQPSAAFCATRRVGMHDQNARASDRQRCGDDQVEHRFLRARERAHLRFGGDLAVFEREHRQRSSSACRARLALCRCARCAAGARGRRSTRTGAASRVRGRAPPRSRPSSRRRAPARARAAPSCRDPPATVSRIVDLDARVRESAARAARAALIVPESCDEIVDAEDVVARLRPAGETHPRTSPPSAAR